MKKWRKKPREAKNYEGSVLRKLYPAESPVLFQLILKCVNRQQMEIHTSSKAGFSGSFFATIIQTENQVTVSDEFYGDKILLTSYETSSFSLLTMSAKVIVFNIMKLSIKFPLRLTLGQFQWRFHEKFYNTKYHQFC